MEIRVAVADPTCAQGLLGRLTGLFDRSSVSFDGTHNEVRVDSAESRSLLDVIDTVQSWLAADGVGSAKLLIEDRSYTMVGPAGVSRPSGGAA